MIRHIASRLFLPALLAALILLAILVVAHPLLRDAPAILRLSLAGLDLALLGLALTGAALAPDGVRFRNSAAWVSIAASAGAITLLNQAYGEWRYVRVWGAAPAEETPGSRFSPHVAVLTDGAIALSHQPNGHYFVDARINGATVGFMVDTGASTVALTLEDARRIGVREEALEFTRAVSTAAGPDRAAVIHIAEMDIGGHTLRNIPALVMRRGGQSLLGMTALEQFSSVEIRQDQLILRP